MSAQQYLFLFTVGPVQGFIAQARKTRDLYAGSAILGDIIDSAIKKTIRLNSANRIIVPDPRFEAKPNRFLARINTENPSEFGEIIEKAARSSWKKIAIKAFGNAGFFSKLDTNGFDEEQKYIFENERLAAVCPSGAKQQIDDLLEIYWVLIPTEESGEGYLQKHNEIQEWLAAIKNTRKFSQIDEPPGRKCTLDGERNALYYRPLALSEAEAEKERRGKFLQEGTEMLPKSQILDIGEGLSAVSLVKRYYAKGEKFPSIPRIALMNVISRIEGSDHGQNFAKYFYKRDQYGLPLNEQLYYEENLNSEYLRKNGCWDSTVSENFDKIQRAHAGIVNHYGKEMSRYYALLVFDGDNMGKIWSGNGITNLEQIEEIQGRLSNRLQVFQELLAARLGVFAAYSEAFLDGSFEKQDNGIEELIKDDAYYQSFFAKSAERSKDHSIEKGKSVYAGGDDFLGFVNLNYLFLVMKELREAYEALVSEPLAEYISPGQLTFSAGVAIAHYKTPLNEVIRWAREMEHYAKHIDDSKDAFAIAVLKHSGEIEKTRYKWKSVSDWMTDDFEGLICELSGKRVSNNFIKTFEMEFRRLSDSNGIFIDSEFVDMELTRLIARSCCNELSRGEKGKEIDLVRRNVLHLYSEAFLCDTIDKKKSSEIKSLSTFLSALNICDFIRRETDKG